MTTVPRLLFHATRVAAMDSIGERGLIGSPYVFACESPEDSLSFVAFRLRTGMTGRVVEREIPATGDVLEDYRRQAAERSTVRVDDQDRVFVQVPELEHHTAAAMLEIDTTLTDLDCWSLSTDHVPFFFGNATSWAYTGSIPTKAIVGVCVYPLDPGPNGGGEPYRKAS
jgi:hypothetical protein